MAYLIMNWNDNPYANLAAQGAQVQGGPPCPPNQMEMCRLICIILINFSMSGMDKGSHIDNYAHAGGLISGFLIGFPFVAKADAPPSFLSNVQNTKIFFLICTLAFFWHYVGTIILCHVEKASRVVDYTAVSSSVTTIRLITV